MTKLAFSHHFLGGSTGFLGDFQRGFVASGVVQSKNFNSDTPQTHYWQQLLLVKNVDSTSQEKLLLVGAESAPARHFRVSKSPALIGLK